MSFIKEHKIGITVLVVVLLAFILYGMFFTGEEDADLTSAGPIDVGGPVGAELITTLFELKSLKLDEKVFSNEVFRNLVDFSQDIPPENQGRDNPFAPLEPVSGSGEESSDDSGGDDIG